MSNGKLARSWLLVVVGSWMAMPGCGAPPAKAPPRPPVVASSATPTPPAPPAVPVTAVAPAPPPPEPETSPGYAEAMGLLRPAGTAGAVQALAAAPTEAEPYAEAALAFAPTEVPAMTLLWGMSYQAMGGGASDAAVASALANVLAERITATRDAQTKKSSFRVRLAPGQMPARKQADGSVHAPLAHVFEGLFSPAVTAFRPPWTIEKFHDVLSIWVGLLATHGTPLDETLELDAWLVTLAKAGHLEAFSYRLLGPAFPAELRAYRASHAAELKAYQDFSSTAALRPTRVVLPDDLVRIQ